MHVTKLGHCCLVIEVNGVRILTDPGGFSERQNDQTDIDIILITHEHGDHLHVESLKEVLQNNPSAEIYTNNGVGKILDEAKIPYTLLEGKDSRKIHGVKIEAFDGKHEEIYEEIGQVQNTGYFIAGKFFYPGDSFHNPGKPIDILALPVAGPWCTVGNAIRYALELNPNQTFPVHDGMLQEDKIGAYHRVPQTILSEHDIKFVPLKTGQAHTF